MTAPRVLAIIPARAGSRGVPDKNIRNCAGFPLMAWSIKAAQASRFVSEIVVSSDSERYLQMAAIFGATGILRPAELATDDAATDDVLAHALTVVGTVPDVVVLLQPTVPIRRPGLVDDCVQRFLQDDADSLFTAFPLPYVWWRTDRGEWAHEAEWETNNPQRKRRQDLERGRYRWLEDGSVYVCRAGMLMPARGSGRGPHRIGGRVHLFPNERTVDIDTEEDFQAAVAILTARAAGNRSVA